MRPNKTIFRLLIVVITLACAGLIWLQVRFLLNTAELKRSSFSESVRTAMARTSSAIVDMNVMDKIFFVDTGAGKKTNPLKAKWTGTGRDSSIHVSIIAGSKGVVRSRIAEGQLTYNSDRPQRLIVQTYSLMGTLDSTLLDERNVVGDHSLPLPVERMKGPFIIRMQTDDGTSTVRVDPKGTAADYTFSTIDTTKRERIVRRVLESFETTFDGSTHFRVSPEALDSLVEVHLTEQSIDLPFKVAIVKGDSVVVSGPGTLPSEMTAATFRIPVGHFTPFERSEDLVLDFPTVGSYLLGQLMGELGLSVALVAVIIACFGYSIRTLLRQQEFAARLTDFINNMTHEFKTPISTVSLASEALERPEVLRSSVKVRRYNSVIRDENKRMRSQIDRILQMASLEDGELAFRMETLSVHAVVRRVAEAMNVQVASRGGTMTVELDAARDVVLGDQIHLENVVHNVLENAVKYSPEAPSVRVRSRLDGTNVILSISDEGIGVEETYLDKVFEKYFRVPTGNIHDVKGFGLGLSYVKLIVEKHGGKVSMHSQPGVGTTITLQLPSI